MLDAWSSLWSLNMTSAAVLSRVNFRLAVLWWFWFFAPQAPSFLWDRVVSVGIAILYVREEPQIIFLQSAALVVHIYMFLQEKMKELGAKQDLHAWILLRNHHRAHIANALTIIVIGCQMLFFWTDEIVPLTILGPLILHYGLAIAVFHAICHAILLQLLQDIFTRKITSHRGALLFYASAIFLPALVVPISIIYIAYPYAADLPVFALLWFYTLFVAQSHLQWNIVSSILAVVEYQHRVH